MTYAWKVTIITVVALFAITVVALVIPGAPKHQGHAPFDPMNDMEAERFQDQLARERREREAYRDPRCDTGARYEAMAQGMDCTVRFK